jgi:GNAT superfamily N-acetyltransferase
MGYVAPDMRGRGVYRTMWNSLVAAARDRDVHVIMGNTDIRNRRMLDVAVALGRQSIAVILKYEIKE